MLNGLFTFFDRFALLPVPAQYAFVIALGLVIGSFVTVVVHRLPIMLERDWHETVQAYLEETQTEATSLELATVSSAARSASSLDTSPAPSATSMPSSSHTSSTSAEAASPHAASDVSSPSTASASQQPASTASSSAAPSHAATARPFNLMHPRSRCDTCGHALRAWENIPVISYVFLRGRCSACRTPIPARYPLIELATGLLAALAWWRFGPGWLSVCAFGFSAVALTLTCIDWQTRLLPDSITLPLLWAGLIVNLGPTFATLGDAVIGAAAGYAFLWIIYWGFWWLRGIEGIGLGDLKLFAAIGAWLGWGALVQVLVLASLAGAVVGIALLAMRRLRRDEPLPFGPFLAIAACITLFAGTPLWPALSLHAGAGFGT